MKAYKNSTVDVNDFVLYHKELAPTLSSFGFDVPLADNRSEQVFLRIQKDFPQLKPIPLQSLDAIYREDLSKAHVESYIELLFNKEQGTEEFKRIYGADASVHLNYELFHRSIMLQVAATHFALKKSLYSSFCYFLGGGMHHASFKQGDGFCPLNDIVVSIRKLQREKLLERVLVLDVDAHKGDGTAHICEHDESIMTVSIHMANAWPLPDETPGAKVSSDIDVAIKAGEENLYLEKLANCLDQCRSYDFDACVVVGGVDVFEGDELLSTASLRLTKEQVLARDMLIFNYLRSRDIAQTWVMAGGYGPESHVLYSQFLLKALHLMG